MLALYESLAPGANSGFLLDFLRVDSRFELQELDLLLADLFALGPVNFPAPQQKVSSTLVGAS
jgi:hypothetical protein